MNRLNALCIKREQWMDEDYYSDIVEKYNIEATKGIEPRLGLPVIWLEKHDETIFQLAQGEMEILKNLRLWYDDVENQIEVRINEHNYKEYDSALYYKIRTGKYDVDLDM